MYRKKYVTWLPDLMKSEDYSKVDEKKVRIRITAKDDEVSVLGDSMYVSLLEEILSVIEQDEIEEVLCG